MKKFFTSLLAFIMLACIVCFTVLTVARTMLKGNNLYDVLVAGVKEKTGSGDIKKEMVGSLLPEEGSEEIIKYINENDFNGQMGDLISSYLKYKSGVVSEKPDMEGFKEMLDEAITKYEKDTGKKVDRKKYDDALNIFEDVIDKEEFPINDKIRSIFNVIYSNTLYYGIIAIFIICLLLIYFINKSFTVVFRSGYIVFIISGVFFFIISLLSRYLNDLDEIEMGAFKKIFALTRKASIIELSVAVVLIVLVIVLKTIEKKKKEAKKEARRLAREEKKRLEEEKEKVKTEVEKPKTEEDKQDE